MYIKLTHGLIQHVVTFLSQEILTRRMPLSSRRKKVARIMQQSNQRGSQSHLVNTKVYKANVNLVDVSLNAKKYY